ncbi:MAG: ROK family protein [Candidatus Saccharicenans sp.]
MKKSRPGNGKKFIGAIDIGGTKIALALFTPSGKPVFRSRVRIDRRGGEEAVEQVISVYFQLEEEAREKNGQVAAVGLCVPGVVNPRTGSVWVPNIRGWKDFDLLKRLKKDIRGRLVVLSDRTAYVLGEAWKGAARGKNHVIYLAVGTGIGAGIMAEGRVIHGRSDLAGAVGWLALNPEFKPGYEKVGGWEWEASGQALERKAREFFRRHPELLNPVPAKNSSVHLSVNRTETEIFLEMARCGQAEAKKIIEEMQNYLAMGLANLISTFNPEMVVLGGGLFNSADLFYQPLKEKFKIWAQPLAAREVEIVLSPLGQEAALYGCAFAALNKKK